MTTVTTLGQVTNGIETCGRSFRRAAEQEGHLGIFSGKPTLAISRTAWMKTHVWFRGLPATEMKYYKLYINDTAILAQVWNAASWRLLLHWCLTGFGWPVVIAVTDLAFQFGQNFDSISHTVGKSLFLDFGSYGVSWSFIKKLHGSLSVCRGFLSGQWGGLLQGGRVGCHQPRPTVQVHFFRFSGDFLQIFIANPSKVFSVVLNGLFLQDIVPRKNSETTLFRLKAVVR